MIAHPFHSVVDEVVHKLENREDRAKVLQRNGTPAFLLLLKHFSQKSPQWALDPAPVKYRPYKVNDGGDLLYGNVRRLYLFFVGGNDKLTEEKRTKLWVEFLESINENDAALLESMRLGTFTEHRILRKAVEVAFPGLLPQ